MDTSVETAPRALRRRTRSNVNAPTVSRGDSAKRVRLYGWVSLEYETCRAKSVDGCVWEEDGSTCIGTVCLWRSARSRNISEPSCKLSIEH